MSILALTEKFLLNNNHVYNVYCGLHQMWMYCIVCEKYTYKKPLQERGIVGTEKWVCQNCKSHSQYVG